MHYCLHYKCHSAAAKTEVYSSQLKRKPAESWCTVGSHLYLQSGRSLQEVLKYITRHAGMFIILQEAFCFSLRPAVCFKTSPSS